MEKLNILEAAGYKVVSIRECDWNKKKAAMEPEVRQAIEKQASDEHITIREALYGGRTEVFKSYIECMIGQKIFADDVCSMYSSVNALDDYAVGYKRFYKPTVEEILDESFIGVVKCDVVPPTDLYLPVLPSRVKAADGSERLTFDLNPKTGVWASVEI
jgi:hypothetical protein